ncbi:ATP-dependent DNA helicase [Trichonephila inaurata madagascariensis]|uniref:ATP-dependent DNA helicase n=1 Tax=Trichonephila inaurata madagascariensis TaxID=2747483 RepID=A0A8X6IUG9_9ARAC|nr:ATP-dependent DNA helicase [Trichonephila inaurata madagascariensis]
MVNRLPRNVDDDYCVNVHIKRRKIHRTNYRMGLVTKRTIKACTSQVPQDEIRENITIQESLTAQQQTLLWNEEKYLRIVPGEASVPRSLLFYEHAEELSFPTIYLGHFRNFREGVRVTPFMIATSELRRVDRRGVTPQHLLYMAMKIMRLRK